MSLVELQDVEATAGDRIIEPTTVQRYDLNLCSLELKLLVSSSTKHSTSVLSLPYEIRDMIYEHAVTSQPHQRFHRCRHDLSLCRDSYSPLVLAVEDASTRMLKESRIKIDLLDDKLCEVWARGESLEPWCPAMTSSMPFYAHFAVVLVDMGILVEEEDHFAL
jgi:hypothetical protein